MLYIYYILLYLKYNNQVKMIVTSLLISGFFVLAIGSFCIKQKYYEDVMKKTTSSYRPLLDDSFTDRVV